LSGTQKATQKGKAQFWHPANALHYGIHARCRPVRHHDDVGVAPVTGSDKRGATIRPWVGLPYCFIKIFFLPADASMLVAFSG